MPYVLSHTSAETILNKIKSIDENVIAVGSYRRGYKKLKDLDLLTMMKLKEFFEKLSQIRGFTINKITSEGEQRISFILEYRKKLIPVDIFKTTKKELPFALFHWTGNKIFNIRTRAHAKRLGYKLNQHGLFDESTGKSVLNAKKERDIFKFLNITYKTPKERNE